MLYYLSWPFAAAWALALGWVKPSHASKRFATSPGGSRGGIPSRSPNGRAGSASKDSGRGKGRPAGRKKQWTGGAKGVCLFVLLLFPKLSPQKRVESSIQRLRSQQNGSLAFMCLTCCCPWVACLFKKSSGMANPKLRIYIMFFPLLFDSVFIHGVTRWKGNTSHHKSKPPSNPTSLNKKNLSNRKKKKKKKKTRDHAQLATLPTHPPSQPIEQTHPPKWWDWRLAHPVQPAI